MATEQPASEKVILLIEDNPDDQALTLRALKKNRIANRILIASDGQEAIDLLFGSDGARRLLPQLTLLDLKLPKVDGLEVLRRIRNDERTKHVPVVMLTSSNEKSDKLASYDLGANSYVRKPVDFDEFVDATRNLGLYWLTLNEVAYA